MEKKDDQLKKFSPERIIRQFVRRIGPGMLPSLRLVSPMGIDIDQELNDLEVASVLAEGSTENQEECISPSKTKPRETPFRPTTVMTNLQRGNVQTTTPITTFKNITIHQMAAQGELILLQQEISEGTDINKVDNCGMTALLWASANGQFPTVEFLIINGAQVTAAGSHGENALLLSACNGHCKIVEYLLQLGLDVNYMDETESTGLMYASFKNHPSCVKLLLEYGADMTLRNEDSYSAMDLAAGQGHKPVQQAMERHMISLFGDPDEEG